MQHILLAGILATVAFSSFVSLPATAGEATAYYPEQQSNKTEASTHRQQHRQQVLNK